MHTTICGHEREVLLWALKMKRTLESGHIPFTMGGRISSRESHNDALTAISMPEKLAEIVAELLRGLSVKPDVWSPEYPKDDPSLAIHMDDGSFRAIVSIPQARVFVLALLNAPMATVEDVEQMIQEVAT
jgi:hypothetical protein